MLKHLWSSAVITDKMLACLLSVPGDFVYEARETNEHRHCGRDVVWDKEAGPVAGMNRHHPGTNGPSLLHYTVHSPSDILSSPSLGRVGSSLRQLSREGRLCS